MAANCTEKQQWLHFGFLAELQWLHTLVIPWLLRCLWYLPVSSPPDPSPTPTTPWGSLVSRYHELKYGARCVVFTELNCSNDLILRTLAMSNWHVHKDYSAYSSAMLNPKPTHVITGLKSVPTLVCSMANHLSNLVIYSLTLRLTPIRWR
jgi:hypothetical protein